MALLLGGIILVLLLMVYQDFKYRGIYWWLFPMLWIGLICYGAFQFGRGLVFNIGGLNSLFILFQVFVLSLYISLKNRKPTNIFQGIFGLGDLLFLLCAAFAFSVQYFIIFYILSLLFAIGVTLLFKLIAKERPDKIPLAGYQALILMAVLIYDQFSSSWHMLSRIDDTNFGIL